MVVLLSGLVAPLFLGPVEKAVGSFEEGGGALVPGCRLDAYPPRLTVAWRAQSDSGVLDLHGVRPGEHAKECAGETCGSAPTCP